MNRAQVKAALLEIGIIPAVRLETSDDALFAAEAVASGGIPVVEVTITVPNAIEVIETLAKKNPNVITGAGSILDLAWAQRSLDAGAKFLTSPGLDLGVVEFAVNQGIAVLPGALTPSEVMAAAKAGADFVKIFPCSQVGGPAYIRALKSPFKDVPLIASGGVNQQTAGEFILAGASVLGIGRDLIQPRAIRQRERDWIRELALRFSRIVKDARAQQAEAAGSAKPRAAI
ncbi:MAG TPA: bifunctional 4-hydroxy-2-oxoglutarate aldolase/2-dehydro-3-deoxy-phosphogluconate aldolase [Bryobacteraceae bacterium]|nr:bifunctional 4-hydroxy-2-oxoglutarate aldolase/2-dehydro-3-deoxy-phosphogluconate aldolase [Bryobacteraceae bacterium]